MRETCRVGKMEGEAIAEDVIEGNRNLRAVAGGKRGEWVDFIANG